LDALMAANAWQRLRRAVRLDKENARIGGVCAGLAKSFGGKPALVRVAVIVCALFLPKLTIAAYLIAWAVLDE